MTAGVYVTIAIVLWLCAIAGIVKLHKMQVPMFEYEEILVVPVFLAGGASALWIMVLPVAAGFLTAFGIFKFFMKVIK